MIDIILQDSLFHNSIYIISTFRENNNNESRFLALGLNRSPSTLHELLINDLSSQPDIFDVDLIINYLRLVCCHGDSPRKPLVGDPLSAYLCWQ